MSQNFGESSFPPLISDDEHAPTSKVEAELSAEQFALNSPLDVLIDQLMRYVTAVTHNIPDILDLITIKSSGLILNVTRFFFKHVMMST